MNANEILTTEVLVIGAGAAGMMAARAAADAGAEVILVDKSVVGRGGATVLAQMTTAVALGEAEPDSPDIHIADTIAGGRGLTDPRLAAALLEPAPAVILEVERYGANWARTPDGRHAQVISPGHSRRRCVYVDILQTGEAVAAALRRAIWRDRRIRRLGNVAITRLLVKDGQVVGALGFGFGRGLTPVGIAAGRVVLATGGLTEIYARNSASANMTGDGFWLAAQAGAELREMEMVQFFPIAHLHPPIVGLDPIMWDPFRYKLGGRLLNGRGEEFMDRYAGEVSGVYTATRDQTTWAIFEEVRQGRGTPHGGAYLDFRDVPISRMEEAFGPVIAMLRQQGVDLTRDMVEVAPMAHFMLGGVHVDGRMRTTVPGLWACGEVIQGLHGANRLSGNAITEALVSGKIAGEEAGRAHAEPGDRAAVERALPEEWQRLAEWWWPTETSEETVPALRRELQQLMWEKAGPLRTGSELQAAQRILPSLMARARAAAVDRDPAFGLELVEKVDLWFMLRVSEAVVAGALVREETRGAHVRLDHPQTAAVPATTRFHLAGDGWRVVLEPFAAGAS